MNPTIRNEVLTTAPSEIAISRISRLVCRIHMFTGLVLASAPGRLSKSKSLKTNLQSFNVPQ